MRNGFLADLRERFREVRSGVAIRQDEASLSSGVCRSEPQGARRRQARDVRLSRSWPTSALCRPRRETPCRGGDRACEVGIISASASGGTPGEAAQGFVYTYPSKKALASIKAKVRGRDQAEHEPAALQDSGTAQCDIAGLDQLPQARGRQRRLQLPPPLQYVGGWFAGFAVGIPERTGSSSGGAISSPSGGRRRAR